MAYIICSYTEDDKIKLNLLLKEVEFITKQGVYQIFEKDSKSALRFPHFLNLCQEFLNSHKPDFKFNSICINKNTISEINSNSENTLLVVLGGESILHLNKNVKINTQMQSFVFYGFKVFHLLKSFTGTILVFF
jgi:hypothetical protein